MNEPPDKPQPREPHRKATDWQKQEAFDDFVDDYKFAIIPEKEEVKVKVYEPDFWQRWFS